MTQGNGKVVALGMKYRMTEGNGKAIALGTAYYMTQNGGIKTLQTGGSISA